MKIDAASKIIQGYANWWRDSVEMYQEGDAVRLVCPMLDRHNDHMSIYIVEDKETGGFILTDIGATIEDLISSGCDVIASAPRKQKLDVVVRGFGIQRNSHELYVKTGRERLFQSMNMLMQSMASIDDLFFTARENTRSFFLDDVGNWLASNGIRSMPDVRVSGQSGFEAKFDFVIPRSGIIAPERFIKAIGTPSQSSVTNALFGWNDIKNARGGDARSYLFLNELNAKESGIDASLISACDNYGVKPVLWHGNANSVLDELAA